MSKIDFETYLSNATRNLKIQQDLFLSKYDVEAFNSWHYDQPSGIFTFYNPSERFFDFQCIGTFSPKANTWLWSWANNNTYQNVKVLSIKIKAFGKVNDYPKLIEETWQAEEVDGWEMLAVAFDVLQPIGVYRLQMEGIVMFIVFTGELTKEQAESRKSESVRLIECDCHGMKRPAFVCSHLNKLERKGFHESFETWFGMELGKEDDFQAWCDDCEKIRQLHDGWNENSEKLTKIKLICEGCYFEMKTVNI